MVLQNKNECVQSAHHSSISMYDHWKKEETIALCMKWSEAFLILAILSREITLFGKKLQRT